MSTRQQLRTYPPDMTVTELVETYYIPRPERNAGKITHKPLSRTRVKQLRHIVARLRWFLHREPLVSDLVTANIAPFLDWLMLNKDAKMSGERLHQTTLESLCRFVGTMTYQGMRGKTRRILSEAPDTLWGICQQRYFKAKLAIRADDTRRQYRLSIADFRDFLGHEPKIEDLTYDNIVGLMKLQSDRGLSMSSVNEKRGRLVALWNWLAKKREHPEFPTIEKLPVPRRVPKAWTQDELQRLFTACREQPGELLPGILAADFWSGLHGVLWNTGERIGAVLACKWPMLDWETGKLEIPAELRKCRSADMLYQLHPTTLTVLSRMKPAGFDVIFPWPKDECTLYDCYKEILKRAGLTHDRKSKFHKMRRSVASHLQARGVDACAVLGHSTPDVTRKSYLDPRIVLGADAPCNVLFQPDNAPLRLEYAGAAVAEPEIDAMAFIG